MQKILIALFLISSKVIVAQLYAPSTTLGNTTNTASGNVGIGVSGPTRRLEVNEVGDNVNFTNVLRLSQANTGNAQSGSGVAMEFAIGNFYNPVIPAGRIAVINTYYNQRARMVFATKSADNTLTDQMVIESNGNVGIGIQSPSSLLHLYNPSNVNHWSANNYGANLVIDGSHHNSIAMLDATSSNPIAITNLLGKLMISKMPTLGDVTSLPIALMSIGNDGTVGIGTGTSVPDAKLAVKGTIHSQEVRVDMQGSMVPDYVFEPTYTLPSLDSVRSYINQNKHLPEVPSAKEMEANGVNLGEMNMLLLKKVEELTLYVIELKKENRSEKEGNEQLRSILNLLIKEMATIKNQNK